MSLSAEQCEIAIGPSKMQCAAIVVLHLASLVSLVFANLSLPLSLALGWALICSCVHSVRTQGLLRGPQSVRHIACSNGRWRLTLADGRTIAARLRSPVLVLGWLAVMHFRTEAGRERYTAAILPDSADAHAFRRLRVFLKLYRTSELPESWWHEIGIPGLR